MPSRPRSWARSGSEQAASPAVSELAGQARGPLIFLVVAATYLGLAQCVIWLNDPVSAGAGLWPAAGLSLSALLLLPLRKWPWVLAAVGAAELGGDLSHGYPLWASFGWAVANCAEPFVGALLLRRFGNPHGSLAPVRQLLLFIGLAVIVAPAVGALIGGTASVLSFGAPVLEVLPKYFVGDALGVLVVAPVILTWGARRARRPLWETLALSLTSLGLAFTIFGTQGHLTATLAYALIPSFTWAALRYGVQGVSRISLGVTMIANSYTAVGRGPFSHDAGASEHAVTFLQIFLGIMVATAFVLAANVSQLSDRVQVEQALRHQAHYDHLTGLPNRAYLAERLDLAPTSGASDASRLTLLVCDIDHLKVINDSMGHSAGDKLITTIGQCLTDSVRPDDLVARISGDEFVVVLQDVSSTTATEMCERIMTNVARPVMLTAHTSTTPSVSIGMAIGEAGSSGESVFNSADAALYEAKKRGRGRTAKFDDRLRERMLDELQIEQDLSMAFSDGQISCVYQPEIVVATGALFGFEALARWDHPERGLIEPDRFVPAVDPTGNAGRLFDHILEETLVAQRRWATNLGSHPAVAVNLSASQLANPHFPESVALALIKAGAPADQLWLELTETGLADTSALSSLTALHDIGIRLALDDFGTGWSSMSRLALYPWDSLKIDRSFIASLGVDPRAEHLVRAMIAMAHSLGILTVGEGVETPDQLSRLTDLGCDVVQGFLFSRPVSARAAVDMVDASGRWTGYPTLSASS